MVNLHTQTIEILEKHNHTFENVVWIGTLDGNQIIPKDEWEKLLNVDYNDGYGANEIYSKLAVVGKDFWLERHEYDGSEWWEYKTLPALKQSPKKMESVMQDDYPYWWDEEDESD